MPLPPPRCLGMDKASLECSAAAAGRSDVLSECSLRTIEGGRQGKPKVEDCAQYLKFPPKKKRVLPRRRADPGCSDFAQSSGENQRRGIIAIPATAPRVRRI